MSQKHRFKKEREFKKRLSDNEENEAGDIRSFTFHSLEKKPFDRKSNDKKYSPKRGRTAESRRAMFDNDKDFKRFDKGNKRGGNYGKKSFKHEN